MRIIVIAAAALLASPALSQTNAIAPHAIDVSGHGKISVPPDTANIHYWLRGEGKTPDDATRSMVDSQKRVESGLREFLGPDAEITNSDLLVIQMRDPNCKRGPGQGALSEDECAIVGYLASSQADVRTGNIAKAGTAVGLASRLGASDVRLLSFELRDTANARQAAMTRAVSDAREQAQILASAAGGHLGRVLTIQYGSYMAAAFLPRIQTVTTPPPPPPPPPPPVEVDMKPRPQDITADVSVSYELLP
ncbi:MAG TPA: SIMPL domain-containing protein [Sphingomicrobium sp.]|nr:SIMPL domain-containing protein [Sphingomicrobium sp.]